MSTAPRTAVSSLPADRPQVDRPAADHVAAALLAVPALLTLVLLLHHPALHGRHGVADVAAGVQAIAPMTRFVHGSIVAMFALQTLGFLRFSASLGWRRPAVGAAFLAYGAGVVLSVIPAMLDGFVAPDLAAACLGTSAGCGPADGGAFRLVAVMIQAFTKVALVAMSAGTFGWACALLADAGAGRRLAGAGGLVCAVVPVAILLRSDVYLRPGNLAGMFAAQVVWTLLAAAVVAGRPRAASRHARRIA